jgi:hypothetical protein
MSGITSARSIRFATLDDPISAAFLADTTTDIQRELDALDVAKLAAMKRPCAIMHTNSMVIPVTTVTIVNFSTEDVDTHGMINLGTNAQRITVSSAAGPGLYYVYAFTDAFNSGSWTLGELTIRKNGGQTLRSKAYNYNGNTTVDLSVSGVVWLGAVNDYVEVTVYHEGGGSDDISTTYLKAFKITGN